MDYRWSSTCPGADFGGTEASATPVLCLDSESCRVQCTVSLESRQGIRSSTCEATVEVEDTRAPVLRDVPLDEQADCDAVPAPAPVTAEDGCDLAPDLAFSESTLAGACPGDYTLRRSWTATDDCGNSALAEQTIRVVDNDPPVVDPGASDLGCLWPPNHRYSCFDRDDFHPVVHDACSEPSAWSFVDCASDQPDDADETDPRGPWAGDGHTSRDCLVDSANDRICVRAERAGSGPAASAGRRYAVTIVATDACGNSSLPTIIGHVHVPHDRGSSKDACR